MTVLLFVFTIALFLTIDWFIRRKRQPAIASSTIPSQIVSRSSAHPDTVRIPEGIFFARSHTWLNLFPSGKIRLGIDDFVNRLLDKPEVTLLRSQGERVQKGDPIVRLRKGERSLTIQSPVAGTILAINTEISADALRQNLFSDGWAYLIKPTNAEDLKALLLGGETREWIQTEFRRLRDLLAGLGQGTATVALQDGGMPADGIMGRMDSKVWEQFQHEFLEIQ